MNSLEQYLCICQNSRNSGENENVFLNVDKVVKCIEREIFNPPFGLDNSPFICETKKSLSQIKNDTIVSYSKNKASEVSLADAYGVIKALVKYSRSKDYTVVEEEYLQKNSKNLFVQNQLDECDISKIVKEINSYLEELKQKLDSGDTDIGVKNSLSIDPENTIVTGAEKELTKRVELRMKINQESIQMWHKGQADICSNLLNIQPTVSALLGKFMSFSDDLTKDYILQFAKMQIELFNLISEDYVYHKKISEESINEDYVNAVLNYEDFRCSIIDNLAAFGVEEITSNQGTSFDGRIHAVENSDSYFARRSRVQKSIRTGFRYKDIIIQKEKVTV